MGSQSSTVSFLQLLAVVYSAFKTGRREKIQASLPPQDVSNVVLSSQFLSTPYYSDALRRAYEELAPKSSTGDREGIEFRDFLLFMHHYRPSVRKSW